MLVLDGSRGEGGGQILRTALSLSMVTGTPFCIDRIRARRTRPGLMRQHLTAVEAAAAISRAEVAGAVAASPRLTFAPGSVRAGEYTFEVGTAGSAILVLQTVLPALVLADGPSRVVLEGGTHNPAAPPFDFLQRSFLPLLARMGPRIEATLRRPGFFPAGGGRVEVDISPVAKLSPLVLDERGPIVARSGRVVLAHLPALIGKREIARLAQRLEWEASAFSIEARDDALGPGNVVMVEVETREVTEVATAFGQRGVRAETVADRVADEVRAYLASDAPVGAHLADQLALPLALAGAGRYRTVARSGHLSTQLDVIQRFLGPVVTATELAGGTWRISAATK